MNRRGFTIAVCVLLACGTALADAVVGFDNGAEGWSGPQGIGGATTIDSGGGNPGANMHTVFNDFGITFRTSSNAEFVGDYTRYGAVTLSIDTQVESIQFGATPVSRPWLVELRDFDDPPGGYPWVSVWYKFADISASQTGSWTPFSVTIEDTSAEELPPGWGGTGAEDPKTFEPMLPPDRTFTSVLLGVDEIVFTTLEPGFFFGFTDHDVRIDNVGIATSAIGGPGEVPTLTMAVSPTTGRLVLSWTATCGIAGDYGVYRGEIGSWAGHQSVDCSDADGDLTEQIPGGAGDDYFLVVPLGGATEGSYGRDSSGVERPPGTSVCRPAQDADSCP